MGMRALFRIITSFFLCALLVFPGISHAAPQQVTAAKGYSNILSQGLVFANICTNPAPKDGSTDDCQCRAQGMCSLAEVTQVGVNIIIFILGISGTVALLMFVYGGWNWVFAQGREGYIQTGKDTMKHAIIGLAIIFGAYAIINFVIAIIGGISPASKLENTIEDLPVKENGDDSVINAQDVITTK
jgi:hypothetical protein